MSSDRLPDREHLIGLAGTTASNAAVLAMGFAIGVMWVGTSIEATGCMTGPGLAGACKLLPTLERASRYALYVVIVGFGVAFGVEYKQQQEGQTSENAAEKATNSDSGTTAVSNTDVTDKQ